MFDDLKMSRGTIPIVAAEAALPCLRIHHLAFPHLAAASAPRKTMGRTVFLRGRTPSIPLLGEGFWVVGTCAWIRL